MNRIKERIALFNVIGLSSWAHLSDKKKVKWVQNKDKCAFLGHLQEKEFISIKDFCCEFLEDVLKWH